MKKQKSRTIKTVFLRGDDLQHTGRVLNGIFIGFISKNAGPRERINAWGISDSKVARSLIEKFKQIAEILEGEGK